MSLPNCSVSLLLGMELQSCEKSIRSLVREDYWGLPGHFCPPTVSTVIRLKFLTDVR
ncbi:hypothetical protein EV356DRAFT_211277 [Viridothelium virens]|uniref:Uncharacterized protein n=1 Tax=Viridothelium virens TaxID=1048519 RepID=A0A6A6H5M9_VIRVR|nr:hypothetical protein EV356DRAFT_211277 [Viridothelium virens]